jgi:hypothetical protein
VKWVLPVAVQVQRKRKGSSSDESVFLLPRPWVAKPGHTCVLIHPLGESSLARAERLPIAAAYPAKLDTKLPGEETTQRES